LRRDVDVVFHLAAIIDVQLSIEKPTFVNHVNACGSLNVLKKSVENNVERFIFASSCAVYGEPKYLPINEEHPLDPLSPYAVSKLAVEKLCRIYSRLYGLENRFFKAFQCLWSKTRKRILQG
jgi:UDP-glucose 4-epimerase